MDIKEIILKRKSVRTFDGNPLKAEDLKKLEEYAAGIKNPFDIPVDFVFMHAKENGLSSPVIAGEDMYVAATVEKKPYADVAFGYSFEQLLLYACSLGVGSVMIGGTMKREVFENAVKLKENEMMPCVSPLGYPAVKKSLKETMMRKGIGADSRMNFDKLFFDGEWGNPLNPDEEMRDVLEMVRWAPSAVNKQPWRIIFKDGSYHFYEKPDKGYVSEQTGDIQKTDVGIALCHFVMALEEKGKKANVSISDPGIAVPEGVQYIASV